MPLLFYIDIVGDSCLDGVLSLHVLQAVEYSIIFSHKFLQMAVQVAALGLVQQTLEPRCGSGVAANAVFFAFGQFCRCGNGVIQVAKFVYKTDFQRLFACPYAAFCKARSTVLNAENTEVDTLIMAIHNSSLLCSFIILFT